LLILSKPPDGAEHVLIGGALLFPSRWSFEEKMNRPLIGIHDRVPAYDDDLARRVQRLFDMLRPERPLVRANWLVHPEPELHQPKLYSTPKKPHVATGSFWLRVERQSLLKLPISGNTVFGVKTFVTPIEALDSAHRAGLIEALGAQSDMMRDYHGGRAHTEAAIGALEALP
ncbi:MAG: heme-dependent oxidative N-demethylase subunit alpha family protein, partial [Pseudomonadota bacterium]